MGKTEVIKDMLDKQGIDYVVVEAKGIFDESFPREVLIDEPVYVDGHYQGLITDIDIFNNCTIRKFTNQEKFVKIHISELKFITPDDEDGDYDEFLKVKKYKKLVLKFLNPKYKTNHSEVIIDVIRLRSRYSKALGENYVNLKFKGLYQHQINDILVGISDLIYDTSIETKHKDKGTQTLKLKIYAGE